jgi:hypothetical protein
MPDVVSVRQTGSLPPASFRFLVTKDTLAFGYVLGTINPHSGLAPVRLRPCRAHDTKSPFPQGERAKLQKCLTSLICRINPSDYPLELAPLRNTVQLVKL